jgi:hypothetical protein
MIIRRETNKKLETATYRKTGLNISPVVFASIWVLHLSDSSSLSARTLNTKAAIKLPMRAVMTNVITYFI